MRSTELYIEKIIDLDAEASAFLNHYGFGEYVDTPAAVPIDKIAAKMGLTVVDNYLLSKNKAIKGITAFVDGTRSVYTTESTEIVFPYKRSTVFIDAALSNGTRRNTIAHECFHWYKHQDFFIFLNKNKDHIIEDVIPHKKTAMAWVEWQAKKMAPRILMPAAAATNLLAQCQEEFPDGSEKITRILNVFTHTFQVSKQSACIRLIELNYPGAQEYYSNSYNKYHMHLSDGIYSIPKKLALELYLENDDFFRILHSECYQYTADGYVVLNDPQYIEENNHTYRLSKNALNAPKDCLLPLENYIYSELELNSSGVCYSMNAARYGASTNKRSFQPVHMVKTSAQLESIAQKMNDDISIIDIFSTAGNEICKHLANKPELTDTEFGTASELSKTVVDAIKNSPKELSLKQKDITYPVHQFNFQTILSACFALHLKSYEVNRILEFTDYILRYSSRQHRAYMFCLDHCTDCTISEANEVLASLGLDTFQVKKSRT